MTIHPLLIEVEDLLSNFILESRNQKHVRMGINKRKSFFATRNHLHICELSKK